MTISGNIIHDSSVAEEIAGHEDLVTEILLRLPVKSLLRFELVSKKWLSLISHPRFAQNYARLHNPSYEPSGVLMTFNIAGFQFVPFNGDGDHARVMLSYQDDPAMVILQSCNGLLICSSCTTCSYPKLPISQSCDGSLECSTIIFPVRKFENYICNPTTKQFTTIRFPSPESRNDVYTVNLAFDPLKSPHYKLLSIRIVDIETSAYQIDIYSSETGSWRPPISGNPLIFTAPESIVFKAPVYWRGAIHWYTYEETDLTSLYFNTDTECLKTMPMPPFQEYHHVLYFGESKGHLHLIGTKNRSVIEFDIWELETDYSRWFVRYHVNLDAVLIAFPQDLTRIESTRAFSILYFARAEKEEESTLVLFVSGKAVSFNFHKNTSKKLCDLVPIDDGLPLDDYDWYDAYQYIETLFHV